MDYGQIGVLGRSLNFPSITDNLAQAKRTVEAMPSPKTRYIGVRWHAWYKKWQSFIKLESHGPKKIKLGFFDSEVVSTLSDMPSRVRVELRSVVVFQDAARAYDAVAAQHGLHLNFPTDGSEPGTTPPNVISQYRGVSWHKRELKWQASIDINGKHTNLGHFQTEVEAAKKYDEAAG
jgi:hypothetical protein